MKSSICLASCRQCLELIELPWFCLVWCRRLASSVVKTASIEGLLFCSGFI